MFVLLNTFPDPAEYADYVCPPVEAAVADTTIAGKLCYPKERTDDVKYLLSSWLDSLFQWSRIPKI